MPSPATLRDGINSITWYADAEIARIWPNITTADELRAAMSDLLPAVVTTYGEAAATLATEWYELDRMEHDVPGRFTPEPVSVGRPGTAGTDELAGWAAAMASRPDADMGTVRAMITGGVQRRIANAARYTITGNSINDSGSHGWYRYTDGDACTFCRMLAGRGAVYAESTVSFGAHDQCGCMAATAWKGTDKTRQVNAYMPTQREIPDTDRARTRAWLRDNIH